MYCLEKHDKVTKNAAASIWHRASILTIYQSLHKASAGEAVQAGGGSDFSFLWERKTSIWQLRGHVYILFLYIRM